MNSAKLMTTCSSVAQSVERVAVNHHVVGSSPARGAIFLGVEAENSFSQPYP